MPLSAKQMGYLAAAWSCFESEPKIDWNKFQQRVGCKSVASARELLRVTKNKLKEEYSTDAQTSLAVDRVKSPGLAKSPAYKITKNKATGNKATSSKKAQHNDSEDDDTVKVKVEPDLLEDDEGSAGEYY